LGRGEGGALLADPPRVERLVAAVVRAVSLPVTLKIRSGPDGANETAVEVAQRAAGVGAAAGDVHARRVAQGYAGGPRWGGGARGGGGARREGGGGRARPGRRRRRRAAGRGPLPGRDRRRRRRRGPRLPRQPVDLPAGAGAASGPPRTAAADARRARPGPA